MVITENERNYDMKNKIAFLGVGNMAGAMLGGILSSGVFSHENIALYNRSPQKYEKYAEYPFYIADSIASAVDFADFIVLAVKPQNYTDVLTEIKDSSVDISNKTFISLAAGIDTKTICRCLQKNISVVRTMPNTPMLIGFGVTALSPNEYVPADDFKAVKAIFDSRGKTICLEEDKMNAVISVTSSSPAYIYLMIEAMLKGAQAEGIDSPETLDIICDTLIGSAQMVKESGKTPSELIAMVKSPKGTTEQALIALEEHKFTESVIDAMHRCTVRAQELAKDFSDSI